MVDTLRSGRSGRKLVRVQIPPRPPIASDPFCTDNSKRLRNLEPSELSVTVGYFDLSQFNHPSLKLRMARPYK